MILELVCVSECIHAMVYFGSNDHTEQRSSQSIKEGWTTPLSMTNSLLCGIKTVLKPQLCFDLKTTTPL